MSENGKWQLAFWIISAVCVGGLTFLGSSVIANDRIRANEDTRIQEALGAKIEHYIQQNNEQHLAIIGDLREIKAKMGIQAVR